MHSSARVPKYQSDSIAVRRYDQCDDNSRDSRQTTSSRRVVIKTEVCLGRLTNPKSCPVHVDSHVPGIRASEYVTLRFERTERP